MRCGGAAAATIIDLVERYARVLPLSVICELLGLPLADRPKFIAWANTVSRLTSAIGFLRMIGGLMRMRRYLEGQLRHARAHGGEWLIAELVRVEMAGGRISPSEMVSMVFLLLGAGSETTTHLISGSVLLRQRALKLQNYFTQPFYCTEPYTRRSGTTVGLAEALRTCREILDGAYDDLPTEAFYFSGDLAEIKGNVGRSLCFGPVTPPAGQSGHAAV